MGAKATELMWRVKALADPGRDPRPGDRAQPRSGVHLRNLKSTPEIEEVVTKCIECGFCEPVCPSRNVTTTPRQRIVVRREIARQPLASPVQSALLEQYEYDAVQTCAADGSCMHACPVAIDTGKLVKELRNHEHGERAERVALRAARHYAHVERAARAGLRAGGLAARVLGDGTLARATTALRRRVGAERLPQWSQSIPQPAPSKLPSTTRHGAAAVYLPACINRIFGNHGGASAGPTLPEALVAVSERAGMPVWIPDDVAGHCCGVPWSSKGFSVGHAHMAAKTGAALARWSDGGRLPIVIDASSCTHGVLGGVQLDGIEVLDSIAWVHDRLLPTPAGGPQAPLRRGAPDMRERSPGAVGEARVDRPGARRGGRGPRRHVVLRNGRRPRAAPPRASRLGAAGRGRRARRGAVRRLRVEQPNLRDRVAP